MAHDERLKSQISPVVGQQDYNKTVPETDRAYTTKKLAAEKEQRIFGMENQKYHDAAKVFFNLLSNRWDRESMVARTKLEEAVMWATREHRPHP